MSEKDPYRSPTVSDPTSPRTDKDPSAPRRIVIGWERLRIWYNLVLLFPGLVILWVAVPLFTLFETVFGSIAFIAAANAFFFLGPLVELYLTAIHFTDDFTLGRRILFGAGLLLSLLVMAFIFLGLSLETSFALL